ncbi:alanyl-tRNA editing protein [Lacibacterium aquatile]|uniref:Alanine--tRNA ligase n=1 Tax=Lacibacterium aquatile TaxID=1168082 RepID=A0ABW5DMB2_9PROT
MSTQELFREDGYKAVCTAIVTAVDEAGVRLDRTVFYPNGGGQPGDTGRLTFGGTSVDIADTRKGAAPGEILHVLAPGSVAPAVGDEVTVEIDWARRHRFMRMHTCLHLLTACIPAGVTGGQVSDGKGRLDFDMGELEIDREAVETNLNALIKADHPVSATWISDEEMAARPDLVKTMSVKPPSGFGKVRLIDIPGVDLQPCGGTHVARTGEIGPVRIEKIENKGKRNRRVALAFVE